MFKPVEFRDEETGVVARVFHTDRGFMVRIIDVDAGESLPVLKTFPTADAAIEFARRCAPGAE